MKISGYENFEVIYSTRDNFTLNVVETNKLSNFQLTFYRFTLAVHNEMHIFLTTNNIFRRLV